MNTLPHPDEAARAASVDRLQDCLRCELSAVAAYERALTSAALVGLERTLHEILMSHTCRAGRLEERLRHLGAEPTAGGDRWGAVAGDASDVERAITALQDGEQRGLALYAASAACCDLWTRTLLSADFLPEQQRTRDLSWSLRRYVEATG
jgi:hypothetical protein